ncbi:hypothetical protein H072_2504 [Dactylellina haptotyla CBS 200.50]|uniref:PA14 domain-containing protein n=1 Tax=Dactylellina haptotyla (strain CBS 200.50) TaxID=1284197 RepID=S8C721_DACHA|nr:hypothetical protein H072_2504 [Dactylellina haptotyla CBS 200.50]
MLFSIGALALLALSGRAAAQSSCVCSCTQDDCLKAVVGTSAFPSDATVADCRSYLWTHSTHASTTIRVTHYVTSSTITNTVGATFTVTVSDGTTITTTDQRTVTNQQTVTLKNTATVSGTVTVSETVTTLETVTATNTVTTLQTLTSGTVSLGAPVVIVTSVVPGKRRLLRRQGGSIPDYAAVCDASAYASGCQCIGVTLGGTLYIQADSTTVTVTATVPWTHVVYSVQTDTVTEGSQVIETQTQENTVTQVETQTENTTLTTLETQSEATTVTQVDTQSETKTQTANAIIPQYTSFALQLTNDVINGDFIGAYLSVSSTDGRVVLDNNPANAGRYQSDAAGNVTYSGNFPFIADATSAGAQFYNKAATATLIASNCWIDNEYFFYCNGPPRRQFFGATNATGDFRFFSYAGAPANDSPPDAGPFVIKAVPYPAADATTLPPAGAKQIVIRAKSVASNGAFQGQYWGLTNDGTAFPRVFFVNNVNNAVKFLVDPTTGHFLGTTNIPFIANAISQIEQFYYASLGKPKDIISCFTSLTDSSIWCERDAGVSGLPQYFAGASNGYLGIYNDTTSVAANNPTWVVNMQMEYVLNP